MLQRVGMLVRRDLRLLDAPPCLANRVVEPGSLVVRQMRLCLLQEVERPIPSPFNEQHPDVALGREPADGVDRRHERDEDGPYGELAT